MQNIKQNKFAKAISNKLAYNTQEVLEEMIEEGKEYVKPEELYARKCINAIEKEIKGAYIFKKDNEIYPLINKELNAFNEKLQKDGNEFNKFKEFLKTTYVKVLEKRFSQKDIIDVNNPKAVNSMANNAMFMYLKGGNEKTWANTKVRLKKKAAYPFYEMVKDTSPLYTPNDPIGVQSDEHNTTIDEMRPDLTGIDYETEFALAGLSNKYPNVKIDLGQVEKGIKVEMEHTSNKQVALKIALDHLAEISNYYDLLAEMEDKAKEMGTFNKEIKEDE